MAGTSKNESAIIALSLEFCLPREKTEKTTCLCINKKYHKISYFSCFPQKHICSSRRSLSPTKLSICTPTSNYWASYFFCASYLCMNKLCIHLLTCLLLVKFTGPQTINLTGQRKCLPSQTEWLQVYVCINTCIIYLIYICVFPEANNEYHFSSNKSHGYLTMHLPAESINIP